MRSLNALTVFILLQLADLATTIAAFACGAAEKNPLVARAIGIGGIRGLVCAKLLALLIGCTAAVAGKNRGLRIVNVVFLGIVLWNLSIISRLLIA